MTAPRHKNGDVVSIEFLTGNKMKVTLSNRHYNVIYSEWVYFAKELGKNILESNILE